MTEQQRCGFVAVIGAPNVGKTTLMNALIGQKMGIVSPKVQTTRMRLRGIALKGESQIILVDTPGIFAPQKRLDRAMVHEAWAAAQEADIALLVLDASVSFTSESANILERLNEIKKPLYLVLNKIDLVAREKLLSLLQKLNEQYDFKKSFLISAEKKDGTEDIKTVLANTLPQGTWLYPADQAADIPSRLLAAEITREKLFLTLHQELPYAISVETENWKQQNKAIRIEQTIYVRRAGQKAIVLGAEGRTIKRVGEQSRRELESFFNTRVHLFLFVKVRKDWQEDPERYRALGLTYKV